MSNLDSPHPHSYNCGWEFRLLRKEMQEDGICEPDIEMAIKKIKQLRQEN